MANAMMFPATFDEFTEIFSFIDSKEYYTNGSELIQVFRVKQWLEHEANRQQAENERLKKQLNSKYKWENMLDKKIKEVRAEAIKEFWNRLQGIAYRSEVEWSHGEHPMLIELDDAEEIYEEMVGDADV